MSLQEPKVEFVPIDTNVITGNSCADAAVQTVVGGGQRCTGTQPDAEECANFDVSIPW